MEVFNKLHEGSDSHVEKHDSGMELVVAGSTDPEIANCNVSGEDLSSGIGNTQRSKSNFKFCALFGIICLFGVIITYLMYILFKPHERNEAILWNESFFVYNNGPFTINEDVNVTFTIEYSGNSSASAYIESNFRMICCDGYLLETSDQNLPSVVTHSMIFLDDDTVGNSNSSNASCGSPGWCQFEWNVTSSKSVGTFSTTSNVTTFNLSDAVNFVDTSHFSNTSFDSDNSISNLIWNCSSLNLTTPEIEPWSNLEVGSLILSNYNKSMIMNILTSSGDELNSCNLIYRQINQITGQGSGVLVFNTSDMQFDSAFQYVELDWNNAISNAEIVSVVTEVSFNISSNESTSQSQQVQSVKALSDSGDGSFDTSMPLHLIFDISKQLNANSQLGATLDVNGGVGLSGNYKYDKSGGSSSFSVSLLETDIDLSSSLVVMNTLSISENIPLSKITAYKIVVWVGYIPLELRIIVVPHLVVEVSLTQSLEASLTAGVSMNGVFTVTGSTYADTDLISITDSTFDFSRTPITMDISEASCSISSKVGLASSITVNVGLPGGLSVLTGSVSPTYDVTLTGYSPPQPSADCDCASGETLSTGVSLGMSYELPLDGEVLGLTVGTTIDVDISTAPVLESCQVFPDFSELCGACAAPTSMPTSSSPVLFPTSNPTTYTHPPTLSPTSYSESNGICDFIAATNIESIFSEWECDSMGHPVTDPCGEPMWNGGGGYYGDDDFVDVCVEYRMELRSLGITGTIPLTIDKMTTLTYLDLQVNWLSSTIPSSISSLVDLQTLYLNGNSFTGSIPNNIGSLINVQYLTLFQNCLTGSLPESLGSAINLIEIDVEGNYLSGRIPTNFGDLPNMKYMYLYYNDITGPIPSNLGSVGGFSILYLQDTYIDGPIPSSICNIDIIRFDNDNALTCYPSCMGDECNCGLNIYPCE